MPVGNPHRYRWILFGDTYIPDLPIPEKWFIKITLDNFDDLDAYRLAHRGDRMYSPSACSGLYMGSQVPIGSIRCFTTASIARFLGEGYKEITTEQFRIYVLGRSSIG